MYKNNFTFSIPGAKDNILAGTKVLTIRKSPAKVGKELALRTGSRWIKTGMPGCLELIFPKGEGPICTGSWAVRINRDSSLAIMESLFFNEALCYAENAEGFLHFRYRANAKWSNIEKINFEIMQEFAKMDGWNNSKEMFDFFKNAYGLPFDGFINYWG